MQKLIEILEREIDALLADFAAAGSELERIRIQAAIDYKQAQLARLKPSIIVPRQELTEKGQPTTSAPPLPQPSIRQGQKGEMWAFLVGVNNYDDQLNFGNLKYCANDAKTLAGRLRESGYAENRLRLLTDQTAEPPTREKIEIGFEALAKSNKIKPGDLLLFYYSGHGAADEQDTYLVSRSGHARNLAKYAVKLSDVLNVMRASPASKKIIILDACKSGADIAAKDAPAMPDKFIANVYDKSAGIAIFASCRKGERSYLHEEKGHSAFTYYLLEAIKQREHLNEGKFLTLDDVYAHVYHEVLDWAAGKGVAQTPTLWSETSGKFILADYR